MDSQTRAEPSASPEPRVRAGRGHLYPENPALVRVWRGDEVESQHRGAWVVCDADGTVLDGMGSWRVPIFTRSSVKSLQALPLIESGAAARFGYSDADVALALASHNAEAQHTQGVSRMLERIGLDARALQCGSQTPGDPEARNALREAHAKPTALHNNCSGKHAGFLCLCQRQGWDPRGYVRPDHEAMRAVTASVEQATGARVDPALSGTDGCSIPAHAFPLVALARGFARFGTGAGLGEARGRAAARLRAAVAAAPFMVAGTKRFDTEAMALLGPRAFVKMGAEGVHCGAFPDLGLGYAVKVDDGAVRAAEAVAAALLRRFLAPEGEEAEAVARLERRVLTNWNGIEVGEVRAAGALAA